MSASLRFPTGRPGTEVRSVTERASPGSSPPDDEARAGPPLGLTSKEAALRLAVEGPNRLPLPPRVPAWRLFASEMVHFFALLFWIAGALAFAARRCRRGPRCLGLGQDRFPFDARRRRMSVIAADRVLVRGAPER